MFYYLLPVLELLVTIVIRSSTVNITITEEP